MRPHGYRLDPALYAQFVYRQVNKRNDNSSRPHFSSIFGIIHSMIIIFSAMLFKSTFSRVSNRKKNRFTQIISNSFLHSISLRIFFIPLILPIGGITS